jgi:hypothetical protein
VSTKSPKADKQYVWEAEADSSSYVIKEETDPEKMLTRGTQITLYLRVRNLKKLCLYDLYPLAEFLLLSCCFRMMTNTSLLTLRGFKA